MGCKSDYPDIEYEGNPGKVEFDPINAIIPIKVAIDDPLYESFTRGSGVPDKDTIENILVYAFYTPWGIDHEPNNTNYSEPMNPEDDENIYCLVDDANDNSSNGHGKKAHLYRNESPFLQWTDASKVYYNRNCPQARYRFFAYYLDDAVDMAKAPNRSTDYVSYNVEIDGTQDLMCSYAQPTKEQRANAKEELSKSKNKYIVNNLDTFTYSTESANLGLIPTFKMEHQLTYVKFKIKSERVDGILDPEIENMRVRNIIIKDTPFRGEFIVAAEDTSRLGITFTQETTDFYMPGLDKPLIPTEDEQEVGAGFLLPPSKGIALEMDCYIDENGNNREDEGERYTNLFNLVPDKGFLAGHLYEVAIKVYGPRHITLLWGAIKWEEGGDIIIGKE